ncbi:MAG: hypothetical protein A2270_10560 [Elusimicrobia bacterium RIFOXYA12_FULL_51_18]|nr:MAG: hypothetical protein A2270_10560 [Elusimicrobia bacterium RIFOXYA12_FULL_51_18]OGS29494.1 MAG: hypothetical protein A2218_00630 [Elusimicrobia bacterium RIFOXYA2_FULL_53_38]
MAETQALETLESKFEELTAKLRRERFYGTLEVHYQDGRLVRVKKHETLLVKDMRGLKEE